MQKRINKIKLKISQSLTKKKNRILLCNINNIKFPFVVSLFLAHKCSITIEFRISFARSF